MKPAVREAGMGREVSHQTGVVWEGGEAAAQDGVCKMPPSLVLNSCSVFSPSCLSNPFFFI